MKRYDYIQFGALSILSHIAQGAAFILLFAAFGGTGEITLCCYARGGDSHTRIAEKMARVMRFSGSLVHYGGGLALLQSPKCAIGHEKGAITFLRMTMAFTHYPNQCYSMRKEEFLC